MPKNAIVSIAIGDHLKRVAEITFPSIRRYADKIGAEFIAITEQKIAQTPPWEKFQMLDFLGTYSRILYLDANVLIRKCCPNIFDSVPETHLGVFNEAPFVPYCNYAIQRCIEEYENLRDFKWDGKYYNTGVMVLSRCHRLLFRKPQREIEGLETNYFNALLQRQKPPIFEIDYKFNRMSCLDAVTGRHRYESYIIHYARMREEQIFGPLVRDAGMIEELPDDYESPKFIWLHVDGNLSEEMQAEPTIRFALTHVWPGADIRVTTSFPELFAHLPIQCGTTRSSLWNGVDSEPFYRETMPGPDTFHSKIINRQVSHSVDFSSMAALSRILPDVDKTCHLKVDPEAKKSIIAFAGRDDFSDCVLVHAGSWEGPTSPTEWWQALVDGIIDLNLTPIFIGKDADTQTVQRLEGRDRAIDLTNALTLSELIAMISMAPILVSNDSAPVPIAGAFDNWIILIPALKHPDHVLPYRSGSKSYKTAAFYKKLAFDDICQSILDTAGIAGGKIKGPWENYLPEVEIVLNKIKEIKNS